MPNIASRDCTLDRGNKSLYHNHSALVRVGHGISFVRVLLKKVDHDLQSLRSRGVD